jgi:hypothetical protein
VVWIAETIQEDHRAAIDWLNANTTEDFSFFAIEIELWKIGNSAPAPRFNIIARPNVWNKPGHGAEPLVDLHRFRPAYGSSFAECLKQKGSKISIRPRGGDVVWLPTGRSGAVIVDYDAHPEAGRQRTWLPVVVASKHPRPRQ